MKRLIGLVMAVCAASAHGQEEVAGQSLGSLSAIQQTVMSAPTSGVINRMEISALSTAVKQGDTIAKLDCSVLDAELRAENAKASKASHSAKQAQIEYDYVTKDGQHMPAISKNDLASSKNESSAAWASANAKKAALAQCTIKAPYDGVVANIYARTGQYVNAGDPIVELVDNSQLIAEFRPPAWTWDRFQTGELADINILPESTASRNAVVKVIERGGSMDASGQFTVRAVIQDGADGLVTGMPFLISHEQQEVTQTQ